MAGKVSTAERKIARVASRAHGVVTRRELLAGGLSRDEIDHRLGNGSLLPEYRGVYRVGHRAPSVEAAYMAAVKACGEGAVLSGLAAGWAHGLLRGRKAPLPQVTTTKRPRSGGLKPRRTRHLDPREATTWKGIPITTVARTLVDLAASLSFADLALACHEAGVRHRTTPAQVEAVLDRRPNSPGAGKLRRILRGEAHVTLSRLERRFLDLLRQAKLPLPHTNRRAGTKRVDCRWPEHRLTVELDSYRYHNSRHAWEQDHRREREAHARGDEFRRYTWRDVTVDPDAALAELGDLLPRNAAHANTTIAGSSGSR